MPAAVTCPVKKRPKLLPASMTARYPRDIGHRAQSIHLLRPADARHHFHRDDGGALLGRHLHLFFILGRGEETDERLPLAQSLHLRIGGLANLGDDVRGLPQLRAGLDDLDARGLVIRIREPGQLAGPGLDGAFIAQLLQLGGGIGRHGDPRLARVYFFRRSDLQRDVPLLADHFLAAAPRDTRMADFCSRMSLFHTPARHATPSLSGPVKAIAGFFGSIARIPCGRCGAGGPPRESRNASRAPI